MYFALNWFAHKQDTHTHTHTIWGADFEVTSQVESKMRTIVFYRPQETDFGGTDSLTYFNVPVDRQKKQGGFFFAVTIIC